MNFTTAKVPLSPNFAQSDNLPTKFGNFSYNDKKFLNPRGIRTSNNRDSQLESQRLTPLGQTTNTVSG